MLALAVKLSACLLTVLTVVSSSQPLEAVGKNDSHLHVPCQSQANGIDFNYMSLQPETIANIEPSNIYIARDCLDFYEAGRRQNGIYAIRPEGFKDPFPVYCDMENDGGGWTVIQRRGNYGLPDDFFMKNWNGYKNGFGNLDLEFWLGNDKISALTLQGKYQLKIDTYDMKWMSYSYKYGIFIVDNEMEFYKLTIGNFTDSKLYNMMAFSNGSRFSTYDRDNDYSTRHCASNYQGGFWYSDCTYSLLNSYKHTKEESNFFRIYNPSAVQIRYSQMKIRR